MNRIVGAGKRRETRWCCRRAGVDHREAMFELARLEIAVARRLTEWLPEPMKTTAGTVVTIEACTCSICYSHAGSSC
jgi:hypothetical protein